MDANQYRAKTGAQIAQLQHHRFFSLRRLNAFEPKYAKSSEAAWEIRLGNFIQREQIPLSQRTKLKTALEEVRPYCAQHT